MSQWPGWKGPRLSGWAVLTRQNKRSITITLHDANLSTCRGLPVENAVETLTWFCLARNSLSIWGTWVVSASRYSVFGLSHSHEGRSFLRSYKATAVWGDNKTHCTVDSILRIGWFHVVADYIFAWTPTDPTTVRHRPSRASKIGIGWLWSP